MGELSPPHRFIQKHKHHAALAQQASKVCQVSSLSTPAVTQQTPRAAPEEINVLAARTNPTVLPTTDMGGAWHKQDEAPGPCPCWLLPIKELKRDEGPQRAVILVRWSTSMGCQILTIGAIGWAPAGLIFHGLPPHCLEQQKGDH